MYWEQLLEEIGKNAGALESRFLPSFRENAVRRAVGNSHSKNFCRGYPVSDEFSNSYLTRSEAESVYYLLFRNMISAILNLSRAVAVSSILKALAHSVKQCLYRCCVRSSTDTNEGANNVHRIIDKQ